MPTTGYTIFEIHLDKCDGEKPLKNRYQRWAMFYKP